MSKSIQHVNDFQIYSELTSKLPCMVKFTAQWCGPCKNIGPFYQTMAEKHSNNIRFLEVDIDSSDLITKHENIESIPLFIFYHDGQKKQNLSVLGAKKDILQENLHSFLSTIMLTKRVLVSPAEKIAIKEPRPNKVLVSPAEKIAIKEPRPNKVLVSPAEKTSPSPKYLGDLNERVLNKIKSVHPNLIDMLSNVGISVDEIIKNIVIPIVRENTSSMSRLEMDDIDEFDTSDECGEDCTSEYEEDCDFPIGKTLPEEGIVESLTL
jgi:thioredoxin 1